ncbi:histone methyltransferase set2 [Podila humilis]|nr:histone methyltransferase set2 [Podila humilis]
MLSSWDDDEEDSVMECGQVARLNVVGVVGASPAPTTAASVSSSSPSPSTPHAMDSVQSVQYLPAKEPDVSRFVSNIPLSDLFRDHEEKQESKHYARTTAVDDLVDDDDLPPIHRRRHFGHHFGRRVRLIDSDDDSDNESDGSSDHGKDETKINDNCPDIAETNDGAVYGPYNHIYASSSSSLSSPCDDLDSQLSLTPPPSPPLRPRSTPPTIKHLPSNVTHGGKHAGQIVSTETCLSNAWRTIVPVDPIVSTAGMTMANARVDVIRTEKKGFGLRAMHDIEAGDFVMEYIGEVLPHASFIKRTREYSLAGVQHFYFMSLQADEVIDATKKGCLARFINHSCNPNCHLEKWVVGRKLRIGIFSIKRIAAGDELTFDYQLERYGVEAQKCYCGESNCTGFIGRNNRTSIIRHDIYSYGYSLVEDADQDEIELENEIILRAPKKEKIVYESNHSDRHQETSIAPLGMEDPTLMEKLARIMFMKPKVPKSKRLLAKLMATTDRTCLRRFVVLHGLVILKAWLRHYRNEADIVMGIMILLPNLPLVTRNPVEDSMIEDAVQEVAIGPDCQSKDMAQSILQQWKELKSTYRIPKARKSTLSADSSETPVEEHMGLVSPSESVASSSTDVCHIGKRFQDDEPLTSPVVEKRIKFHLEAEVSPETQELRSEPNFQQQQQDREQDVCYQWSHDNTSSTMTASDRYGQLDKHHRQGSELADGHSSLETLHRSGVESDADRRYDHGRGRTDEHWKNRDKYHDPYQYRERSRDQECDRDRYRENERLYRNYQGSRSRNFAEDREYRESESYSRDQRPHKSRWDQAPPSISDAHPVSTAQNITQARWIQDEEQSEVRIQESSGSSTSTVPPVAIDLVPRPTISIATDVHQVQIPTAPVSPSIVTPTTALVMSIPLSCAIRDTEDPSHEDGGISQSPSGKANLVSRNEFVASSEPLPKPPVMSYESEGSFAQRGNDPRHPYREAGHDGHDHRQAIGGGHHQRQYDDRGRGDEHDRDRDHVRYRRSSLTSRPYFHAPSGRYYSTPSYHRSSYRDSQPRRYSSLTTTAHQEDIAASVEKTATAQPTSVLPHGWASAKDPEGKVYYYNQQTRITQWDFPSSLKLNKRSEVPETIPPLPVDVQLRPLIDRSNSDTSVSRYSDSNRTRSEEYTRPLSIGSEETSWRDGQDIYGSTEATNYANTNAGHNVARAGINHCALAPSGSWNGQEGRLWQPAKPLNERDLKSAISSTVVKTMTKYKIKLESSDAFKRHARKITHLIADKEMRTVLFMNGQLTELNEEMKEKIRKFTQDYLAKTFKRQEEQYRREMEQRSTVDILVNGNANGGSHITITGVPPTPALSSSSSSSGFSVASRRDGEGFSSVDLGRDANGRFPVSYRSSGDGEQELKCIRYEDVDVDDESDIRYGDDDDSGDDIDNERLHCIHDNSLHPQYQQHQQPRSLRDDDNDDGEDERNLSTIPKRRDHHHSLGHYEEDADVAAVPSSSVEP